MSSAVEVKPRKHTKLHSSDVKVCEGVCCSDGAFLLAEEVLLIHRVVKENRQHFALLPDQYIIDGEWEGETGPQTNVREHVYREKPAHFKNTRCVFTEADGKCSLQTLAVKQGVHKWKYKPMGCWLFPLMSDDKGLVAPPRTRRDDPNNLGKRYPGFSTSTPCGSHSEQGRVWWIALKEEVAEYRK